MSILAGLFMKVVVFFSGLFGYIPLVTNMVTNTKPGPVNTQQVVSFAKSPANDSKANVGTSTNVEVSFNLGNNFSKKLGNLYYFNTKVADADPETFVFLNESFFKDKNHVYFYVKNSLSINVFQGLDPTTVAVLGERAIKDKKAVYILLSNMKNGGSFTKLENVDPGSFKVVYDDLYFTFYSDKTHVYYQATIIPGINPKSVRTFKEVPGLIMDDQSIYIINPYETGEVITKVDGIDASTFSLSKTDASHASDQNNQYLIDIGSYGVPPTLKKVIK
jgi:hypothetical protein